MTTLEQAARMALEALQLCANGTDDTMLTRDALADLRQALEQPASWQEIECPCCGDLARAFPPAPKREWVGLAEDEMTEVANTAETYTESVKLTEAKLKEKNT